MTITTLLFDVGDVLVDIDWQRGCQKMFGHMKNEDNSDLSLKEIAEKLHPNCHETLWNNFGTGLISQDQFLHEISQLLAYKGDFSILISALSEVFEPLPERIDFIKKIIESKKYDIALISDTNALHMTYIENLLVDLFKTIPDSRRYYSYKTGLKKMFGKEMYEHVLSDMRVQPQNALMIDDRLYNKKGADAIGLNFLLIQKEEDLETALRAAPYSLNF